jgi:RHS repeat-associated protein
VATQTASYDAAGDLTGDGTQTYQWDAEGHLTQVYNSVTGTTSTFTYNALGQRVGKVRTNPVGNFEYVFDPAGQEAGEFNSNSCCHYWDTRYFRVGGRLLGEYFGGSNTFFIHTTALGSTNQVTGQTGTVQEDTLLYPWGQPWQQAGSSYDNHFAGFELRDTNVSADPTPNRWYTYGVGRWPSPDPAGKGAVRLDDPQTWNMYAYVRNNPTTLTDPSGLYTAKCDSDVKNCSTQITNYDKSLQQGLKSKNQGIRKAAEAYGKLGDKNGVIVTFANVVDPKHSDVLGTVSAQAGTGGATYDEKTNTFQQATQVTIKAGLKGSELEETAVHEGVHVEDRAAVVNSINLGMSSFNRSLSITGRQSEINGHGVENIFRRSIGLPTLNIRDILARPPYSDNPNIDKPLFPDLPGPQ